MKIKTRLYLLPLLVAVGCLFLPRVFTEGMRGVAIGTLTPFWQRLVDLKAFFQSPFNRVSDPSSGLNFTKDQEMQQLLLENRVLKNELENLKGVVEQEYFIFNEMLRDPSLEINPSAVTAHEQEILDLFSLELMHIPARVLYRPLNTWNHSLWIDKGEADNRSLGRVVIAKNSPVVIGLAVVGVVDEVGLHSSRVRLITDSALNPSVRIKRGEWLLAKGELQGANHFNFRSNQTRLKGVGFNYDFEDEEGPARDLRTGEPLDAKQNVPQMPLIQINDLLITTGLDGVFPFGLEIGQVKRIYPLKEGDFAYDLEAESAVTDLNALTVVFVLPPLTLHLTKDP